MPEEKQDTKMRDAVILAVVAALSAGGGGGLSTLRGNESIELRVSILESKVDILWELKKNDIARQLGDMR